MYKYVARDDSGVPQLWTVGQSIAGWRVRIWPISADQIDSKYTSTTNMGEPIIDDTVDVLDDVESILCGHHDRALRGAARNLIERMKAGETFA